MSGTNDAAETFDEHEVATARRTYPNLADERLRTRATEARAEMPKRTVSGTRRIVRGEREARVESIPISPKSLAPPPPLPPTRYPRSVAPVVFVPSDPLSDVSPHPAFATLRLEAPASTVARPRRWLALAAVVVLFIVVAAAVGFLFGRTGAS